MAAASDPRGSGDVIAEEERADLATFLICIDDEDCPDVSVHVAAYRGHVTRLSSLLTRVRGIISFSGGFILVLLFYIVKGLLFLFFLLFARCSGVVGRMLNQCES